MKVPFTLVVSKNGRVRVTKRNTSLAWDEISIKMNLELPEQLFDRPRLEAQIKISDKAAIPEVVSTEMIDKIHNAIQFVTGMEVRLTLQTEEEETTA